MKNILYKYVKLGLSSGNGLVELKGKSKINIAHFSNLYFFTLVFIFLQFLSLESLAQQCDANRLVNSDFSNSLTGWQQTGGGWAVFAGAPNYAYNTIGGSSSKRLSQNVSMVVGPKGVEISFQFSATFGGNGAKLDVEFGGTSYLTLDNSGITGSNVTVTTHNGASVITYPESPVIVYAANDGGRVYRIPSVATNNATATFVIQGPRTYHNDGARCYLSPVVAYTIKGTVWNDANGNAIQNGTEAGLNTGSQNENGLWANLVDESGNVVSSEPVNLDGSYTLYAPVNGNYSIILSTAAQVPGNALITSSLPEGWIHTGTNKYGAADVTNTTGIISNVVVANTNLTNLNFGIERLPESFDQSYLINTPATGQTIVLNGTGAADSPGPLTGSDPEDFASPGGSLTAKTVHITSPASNGTLFYDGIPIPPSTTNGSPFVINNYDPSKLSVVLNGTGYSEVIFEYAYVDIAGKVDPTPATYKIEWSGSLPVKLISFTVEKSEGNTGLLTWTTTEETNSDRFVIERSIDAKSWLALGEKLASGESQATLTYHFTDINPLSGTSYYRLKMVDKDATYTYSRVRSVSFERKGIRLILQPNPVSDILLVKDEKGQDLAPDKVKQIRIVDTQGVSVFSSIAPVSSEGINVRGLASGTYIVKITFTDGALSTHKIIVGR